MPKFEGNNLPRTEYLQIYIPIFTCVRKSTFNHIHISPHWANNILSSIDSVIGFYCLISFHRVFFPIQTSFKSHEVLICTVFGEVDPAVYFPHPALKCSLNKVGQLTSYLPWLSKEITFTSSENFSLGICRNNYSASTRLLSFAWWIFRSVCHEGLLLLVGVFSPATQSMKMSTAWVLDQREAKIVNTTRSLDRREITYN